MLRPGRVGAVRVTASAAASQQARAIQFRPCIDIHKARE